jgi:hypothetical protein
MNPQPSLFDYKPKPSFGTEPRKLVRREGTDTSVDAACKVNTNVLEKLVYSEIKSHGETGCISDDVRGAFPHLPYSSVTARYKALIDKNLIEDTGERRQGNSGRSQRVLRAK